jgi:hypothetical protein
MATFTVEMVIRKEAFVTREVVAEDEDEAADIAYEMYEAGNLDILASDWWDYDFDIEDTRIHGDDE